MRLVFDSDFGACHDICERHNVQVNGSFFEQVLDDRIRTTTSSHKACLVSVGSGVNTNLRTVWHPIIAATPAGHLIEEYECTRNFVRLKRL